MRVRLVVGLALLAAACKSKGSDCDAVATKLATSAKTSLNLDRFYADELQKSLAGMCAKDWPVEAIHCVADATTAKAESECAAKLSPAQQADVNRAVTSAVGVPRTGWVKDSLCGILGSTADLNDYRPPLSAYWDHGKSAIKSGRASPLICADLPGNDLGLEEQMTDRHAWRRVKFTYHAPVNEPDEDRGEDPMLFNMNHNKLPQDFGAQRRYELVCGGQTTNGNIVGTEPGDRYTMVRLQKGCTLRMLGSSVELHGNTICVIEVIEAGTKPDVLYCVGSEAKPLPPAVTSPSANGSAAGSASANGSANGSASPDTAGSAANVTPPEAPAKPQGPTPSAASPPSKTEPAASCDSQIVVFDPGGHSVNLRDAASIHDGHVIAAIPNCTKVCKKATHGAWIQVDLANASTGYVNRKMVRAVGDKSCP